MLGFHGLVCSGTTSKQIDKRDATASRSATAACSSRRFVALIALATVMIVGPRDPAGTGAGTIYGEGIGLFLTRIIGK